MNMNQLLPVMLARGGRGSALEVILIVGVIVLIFAIAMAEHSQNSTKKD